MLPSELLVARKYGNTIRPIYAKLIGDTVKAAEKMIVIFTSYIGRKKREVKEAAAELEGQGYDYRYVRGLYTLLERRCQFQTAATIPPDKVRWQVFHATVEQGIPSTLEERQKILDGEAAQLQISAKELEDSLYADLDEELIVTQFSPIEAQTLVRQYNLSLTQTLLFRSSEMEFTASANWQRIFRGIKWLGLIYTIRKQDENYWVKVDGPLSLFKLSNRYGTSLAKLIPHITVAPEWRIHAKVLKQRSDRQLLNLKLNSHRHSVYLKSTETSVEEAYDSSIEQDFARRFNLLHTGWRMIREPGPLPVGRQVMIPDFLFEKAGMKVYMEIAGFWTPEYLKHKLQQLRNVQNVDMIVAANRSTAGGMLDKLGRRLNVIYYSRVVPLRPILKHLNAREMALGNMQRQRFQTMELKLEGTIVKTKEIAEQLNILESVVQEELKNRRIPGYRVVGDALISEEILQSIEAKINQRFTEEVLTLHEATQLIEEFGGVNPTRILEALGYRIEWHGIDPAEAIIWRNTRKN
jgi:predicted nuclease of restriction endonuclease-like RecB superfamily